uniref:tRNA-dihydrouridine(16/17) synthase [NAD(P)(+)] n=1 Tax=Ascaris lumbricoides TaxID=6252 RepID=A0A9J2P7A0_ASCLU
MVQGLQVQVEGDGVDGIFVVGKNATVRSDPPTLTDAEKDAKKLRWKQKLQNMRCVVAPMVDQSELAFRMMMRQHGADLCFSPMIHAQLFVKDLTYRRSALSSCPSDRPLIVQFCANEPHMLLTACLLVEDICDGVDLNLGCPQLIAKRGHYGAYLEEDLDLVCEMVSLVHSHCRVPLSCKIRILDEIGKTVNYARALEKAGACMLTVHGRTRQQRGASTGLADWNAIRIVKRAISIPLLANGSIQMPDDVERCLKMTGANAVMSAEGVLSNPLLFEGRHEPNWVVAREYLQYALQYKAGVSSIRAHLFRICHHRSEPTKISSPSLTQIHAVANEPLFMDVVLNESLLEYSDLREKMSYVCTQREFHEILNEIEDRVNDVLNMKDLDPHGDTFGLSKTRACAPCPPYLPHWICKPYFRPLRDDSILSNSAYRERRRAELDALAEQTGLSRRQIRKREKRRDFISFHSYVKEESYIIRILPFQIGDRKERSKKQSYPKCVRCSLPASQGCIFLFCKNCCRYKTTHERLDCKGKALNLINYA